MIQLGRRRTSGSVGVSSSSPPNWAFVVAVLLLAFQPCEGWPSVPHPLRSVQNHFHYYHHQQQQQQQQQHPQSSPRSSFSTYHHSRSLLLAIPNRISPTTKTISRRSSTSTTLFSTTTTTRNSTETSGNEDRHEYWPFPKLGGQKRRLQPQQQEPEQQWNRNPYLVVSNTKTRTNQWQKFKQQQQQQQHLARQQNHARIDETAAKFGMPWKYSMDPTYEEVRINKDYDLQSLCSRTWTRKQNGLPSTLFYMPFWEWQMAYMKEHLTNLQVLPVTSKNRPDRDLSLVENTHRGMRLHTLQCTSEEYKFIRMTVLDGGPRMQVFTSLWCPNPRYNLPILGIDLLQFNQRKHLCVVDFQPIHDTEGEHDQRYEHLLQPIRERYPSLQGKMSNRFFDENSFFSRQMLFGRCDATLSPYHDGPVDRPQPDQPPTTNALNMVYGDLFPAFQAYVQTHVQLIQSTPPRYDRISTILARQAAYDTYSASRDPAHGLLASAFGRDFADDYVYDILFPSSERRSEKENSSV